MLNVDLQWRCGVWSPLIFQPQYRPSGRLAAPQERAGIHHAHGGQSMLHETAGNSSAQLADLLVPGRGERRVPGPIGRGNPIFTGVALDVIFALAVASGHEDSFVIAYVWRHGADCGLCS